MVPLKIRYPKKALKHGTPEPWVFTRTEAWGGRVPFRIL